MYWESIRKYDEKIADKKTKCKCGHTILIPNNMTHILCSWCGQYVFKHNKDEFEYRLKSATLKEKR
ncbi:MAG: hypothetical protein IJ690_07605 [Clostridia bacterium]|nr:hypothetical protein [Clostridia bacterium]MBR1654771.1 hypothetical protein [Clostridia bacterium]